MPTKILLVPPKCEIIFGIFSIASHLVIALPTLRLKKLLLLTSLYFALFLCGFCTLVHGLFFSLLPLRARKSDIYKNRNKGKKERNYKIKTITLERTIEKSSVLLSQYCKNYKIDSTIIILHLSGHQ